MKVYYANMLRRARSEHNQWSCRWSTANIQTFDVKLRRENIVVLFHIYPSGVVDGIVGARIDPQNVTRRKRSDVANSSVIVVHLLTLAWTTVTLPVTFHHNNHNWSKSKTAQHDYIKFINRY